MGDLLYRADNRGLNNRQEERFETVTGQESLVNVFAFDDGAITSDSMRRETVISVTAITDFG
jgi:hypothetical protein